MSRKNQGKKFDPEIFQLLEEKVLKYNNPSFIENDPVSIPHAYKLKQDIEISGLFAAILAWGQRKTIIRKARELMELFDRTPYDFILNHSEHDLKALTSFKHRTFNATDLLYFVHFLKHVYQEYASLEDVFYAPMREGSETTEKGIDHFYTVLSSMEEFPARTGKHVGSPKKKSACKRINMYLRWMVRNDNMGVDFGLWRKIHPSQLVCPCDIHVERVSRRLNLISRKQIDWRTALELTQNLRSYDPKDPVRYDYALFGMGIESKFN